MQTRPAGRRKLRAVAVPVPMNVDPFSSFHPAGTSNFDPFPAGDDEARFSPHTQKLLPRKKRSRTVGPSTLLWASCLFHRPTPLSYPLQGRHRCQAPATLTQRRRALSFNARRSRPQLSAGAATPATAREPYRAVLECTRDGAGERPDCGGGTGTGRGREAGGVGSRQGCTQGSCGGDSVGGNGGKLGAFLVRGRLRPLVRVDVTKLVLPGGGWCTPHRLCPMKLECSTAHGKLRCRA